MSLCTYFNAFPASYWRRWSTLNSVVLRLELTGHGRIDIYRSKADSSRIHVQGREFQGTGVVLELETDLGPFEDGGWIWFDVTTDTDVTVHSAGWFAPVEAPGKASVAVGIPTFNRPADCVAALRALASDPLVMDVIDAMIIPTRAPAKSATRTASRRQPSRSAIGSSSTTRPTSVDPVATAASCTRR